MGRSLSPADIGLCDRGSGEVDCSLSHALDGAAAVWARDSAGPEIPLKQARGVQAIAPVWEWENPPEDADVSRLGGVQVTDWSVRYLRRLRSHYQEMYRRVGGVPVRPRLIEILNQDVAPLLRGSYDNSLGRDLYGAVCGLVAIAGICAYDNDRHAVAQRYMFDALRLAKASGDRQRGAYIIGLLATQALQQDQRRLTVQYAETALRFAPSLTPALVADLHSLAGKAYARMGDAPLCVRHLRASERAAESVCSAGEPDEVSYVQPSLIQIQAAEALRRLGDTAGALPYAEEAVRTASESHLRGRVHRHACLALILAERGEIDRSVHLAGSMLDDAAGMESARIRERVNTVMRMLRPYVAVREVSDLMERVVDTCHPHLDSSGAS